MESESWHHLQNLDLKPWEVNLHVSVVGIDLYLQLIGCRFGLKCAGNQTIRPPIQYVEGGEFNKCIFFGYFFITHDENWWGRVPTVFYTPGYRLKGPGCDKWTLRPVESTVLHRYRLKDVLCVQSSNPSHCIQSCVARELGVAEAGGLLFPPLSSILSSLGADEEHEEDSEHTQPRHKARLTRA